jgi:hypothetical protein
MSNDLALTAKSVGTSLPVLNWIVEHAEQSPAVLNFLQQIVAGATVSDKWTAFKSLGDLIVADIATFPLEPSPAPVDKADLAALENHPLVKANGTIINLLLQNLPQIVSAIQAIVALFNKQA